MQIIPNPVEAALLTLPFLVAMVGLWFILFKPLLAYMDERNAVSDTARREAEEYSGRMADRLAALEEQLTAARAEVSVLRAQARGRAGEAEQKILAGARAAAEELIRGAVTSVNAEKVRSMVTMKAAAEGLAGDIVTRVLAK